MEYIKFNIDEMHQSMVFFEYREIGDGQKGPMITRAISLEKVGEVEPKILQMVDGEIIGIYYESRGTSEVSEVQYLDHNDPMSEEDIEYAKSVVRRACVEEEFDELLKPPTIDEQVEDFIKEFFEDSDTTESSQNDFLTEFFDEIEDKSASAQVENAFGEKTADTKDFLADFFAELEDEEEK